MQKWKKKLKENTIFFHLIKCHSIKQLDNDEVIITLLLLVTLHSIGLTQHHCTHISQLLNYSILRVHLKELFVV